MNTKLIKMLQHATASEAGAFMAYDGHEKSVKDPIVKAAIAKIKREELDHVKILVEFLAILGAKPNKLKNKFFVYIGMILGRLCFFTGFRLPIYGAMLIEKIGINGYDKLAKEAERTGRDTMARILLAMGETEKEHEAILKTCLTQRKALVLGNQS